MKKFLPLLMTALLACLFAACGEDETAKLRWENQSGQTASDIMWVPTSGNNYSYSETLTSDGQTTAFKEIGSSDLNGSGECSLDDGVAAAIDYDGMGNTAILLSEGQSETYNIVSTTAKK